MRNCYFIGGYYDGKVINVDPRTIYRVAVPRDMRELMAPETFGGPRIETYHPQWWQFPVGVFCVFIFERVLKEDSDFAAKSLAMGIQPKTRRSFFQPYTDGPYPEITSIDELNPKTVSVVSLMQDSADKDPSHLLAATLAKARRHL